METPYSNREVDLFRQENKDQFERVMQTLSDMRNTQGQEFKDIKDKQGVDSKIVDNLCRIVSHNSGQITALWEASDENTRKSELFTDIRTFTKVTKWIVWFIIGGGTLYSAIKILVIDNIRYFIK